MDPSRLKELPLFAEADEEDLAKVATFVELTEVSEGKTLAEEGSFSHSLMVIEEGTAEVRRAGERVAELGPGDFFGEMGLVEGELRTASVVATSPMRLVSISRWELKRMERHLPEVVDKIRETIEARRASA